GYDRKQVDEYLDELESATTRPAELPRFRIAFRGYERRMVDAYVRQLFDALPAPSDCPTLVGWRGGTGHGRRRAGRPGGSWRCWPPRGGCSASSGPCGAPWPTGGGGPSRWRCRGWWPATGSRSGRCAERSPRDRRSHDAAEPEVGRGGVDGLRQAGGRAVAAAVVGGAQVRPALHHLAGHPRRVAGVDRPVARGAGGIGRGAAGVGLATVPAGR